MFLNGGKTHVGTHHHHARIPLKVGKSVLLAAQSGKTQSLAWWDASGIPYTHSESVARIAGTWPHPRPGTMVPPQRRKNDL